MRTLIVVSLLLAISSIGLASEDFQCAPRWRFSDNMLQIVKYKRIIDGDTFVVDIPGMPEIFGRDISVRIAGIDAPELHSNDQCENKMAMAVAVRLEKLLSTAPRIDLLDIKRDKYFRILAEVKIHGEVNIGKLFLTNGWAQPYAGGTKPKYNWCKSLSSLK